MKYRSDGVTKQPEGITLMKYLTIFLCLSLFLISAPQHVYGHSSGGSHQHPHDPTLEERVEAAEKKAEEAEKKAEEAKKEAEEAKKEAEEAKAEVERLKKEKEKEAEQEEALGFLDLIKYPIKGVYGTIKYIAKQIDAASGYHCDKCNTWQYGSHICDLTPDPFPEPIIVIDESEPPIGSQPGSQ